NHLSLEAFLHPGQVITLPPKPSSHAPAIATHTAATATPAPAPVEMNHEVAPGETLWGIAHTFGVRVEALAAANNIALDDVLHPGDALVVPTDGSSPASGGAPRIRVRTPPTPAGVGSPAVYEELRAHFGSMLRPSAGPGPPRFGGRGGSPPGSDGGSIRSSAPGSSTRESTSRTAPGPRSSRLRTGSSALPAGRGGTAGLSSWPTRMGWKPGTPTSRRSWSPWASRWPRARSSAGWGPPGGAPARTSSLRCAATGSPSTPPSSWRAPREPPPRPRPPLR